MNIMGANKNLWLTVAGRPQGPPHWRQVKVDSKRASPASSVGAGAGMMWGGGLYGRPLLGHHPRSCSMTRSRHGTRATRAAIKAPTPHHPRSRPYGRCRACSLAIHLHLTSMRIVPRGSERSKQSIRADVLREMACRVVRLACFKFEGGLNLAANLLSHGTASMETAAGRDIDGAGQITSEDNTLPPFLDLRVGDRHCREQGFGIWVLWGCIEIIAV